MPQNFNANSDVKSDMSKLNALGLNKESAQLLFKNALKIFDNSPHAVFFEAIDGSIIDCTVSAERMYGFTKAEMLAMRAHDLVPGEVASNLKELDPSFKLSQKTGLSISVESLGKRKDKTLFPTDVTIFPLTLGEISCFVVVIRDLSSKMTNEKAKEKFKQQMQQISKIEDIAHLVSLLSNEFASILTGVINCALLLSKELPSASPTQERADKIIKSAQKGIEVVSRLMSFMGNMPGVFNKLSLSRAQKDFRAFIENELTPDIKYDLAIEDNLPECRLDIHSFKEAFASICKNAAEAVSHKKQKKLSISVFLGKQNFSGGEKGFWGSAIKANEYICIRCADNGCGIHESELSRVFDPFYSTKADNKGIGMISVLFMLHRHNGSAMVESTPGKGTVFSLFLPLEVNTQKQPIIKSGKPEDTVKYAGDALIISLGKNKELKTFLTNSVKNMSYKAFVENSVTSGLKAFKKTAQNLDIVLVCADCLNAELTNLIKEMHWLNPVISIVLSVAEINSEQKEQLEQLGVSAFTGGACDLIELERAILRAKHSNKPL